MALISCPECGKEISDRAKVCVHCGYPISRVQLHSAPAECNTGECTNAPKVKTRTVLAGIFILVIIAAAFAFWASNNDTNNNTDNGDNDTIVMQQRDLSAAFGFTFDMTIDDVIKYEANTYGNTEYRYDEDVGRLDFELEPDYDWGKHKYFFDKETGLLDRVSYMGPFKDWDDKQNRECPHVKETVRSILNIITVWDGDTHDGLFWYATGQIDGVDVKITYQTGEPLGLSVSRYDEP